MQPPSSSVGEWLSCSYAITEGLRVWLIVYMIAVGDMVRWRRGTRRGRGFGCGTPGNV